MSAESTPNTVSGNTTIDPFTALTDGLSGVPIASPPPLAERTNPRFVLLVFAAVSIVAIWIAIFLHSHNDRDERMRNVTQQLATLARVFEEHTVRTFKNGDQAVLFVRNEFLERGMQLDLSRYVREGTIMSSIYPQIGIIAADGTYVLSSQENFKPVNLADRDHFKVHVNSTTDELYISKPVLGRTSGKWSIQLTRRVNAPDGSFGGVVVVSLDPFYFSRFYSEVNILGPETVALVGGDGIVRSMEVNDAQSLGQDIHDSELFKKMGQMESGSFVAPGVVGTEPVLYSFRRIKDYPLTVVVGMPMSSALADYSSSLWIYISGGVLISVLLLLFTFAMLFLIRREDINAREMREKTFQAESANRMKSEFLASMSHELRTPLNGILGFSELLRDEAENPLHRKFAANIHESGKHLLSLVNSVLDLAKIEAGRMELYVTKERLKVLVNRVAVLHQLTAARKGIKFDVISAPNLPETVYVDGGKLKQVLNNLLNNAVKFTMSGTVILNVSGDANTLMFSIRDSGPGIPESARAEIFDAFRQADSSITRAHGGTGLGLALVRQLVRLMGGQIWFESEVGKGSTFHFTVPIGPFES